MEEIYKTEDYDIIVIGVGYAALCTFLFLKQKNSALKILLIGDYESNFKFSFEIRNYPGFIKISHKELINNIKKQCDEYGLIIAKENFKHVAEADGEKRYQVTTDKKKYLTNFLVLASGKRKSGIAVENYDELIKDKIISESIDYVDLQNTTSKKLIIIGAGDTAFMAARKIIAHGHSAVLLCRSHAHRAQEYNVKELLNKVDIVYNCNIKRISKEKVTYQIRGHPGEFNMDFDVIINATGFIAQGFAGIEIYEGSIYTSKKFIYAAGSIMDNKYGQIVNAAHSAYVLSCEIFSCTEGLAQ